MASIETQGSALIARARAILTDPAATWTAIAAEPATPGDLLTRYAMPLAAIGPVAQFIRGQVFGFGGFGITYRPGLFAALGTMVVSYVIGLLGVVVLALVADFLAPRFEGTASRPNAFKLVVYGSTAAWLAGIFGLLPGLSILSLAGLYSLYLYYRGATPVMRVPEAKAGGYTAVTILCAIVLALVIAPVTAAFMGLFGMGIGAADYAGHGGSVSGKLSVPGVGAVDLDRMKQAGDQLQARSDGRKPPVPPEKLQTLLPAAIGGYQRTALASAAAGGMGSNAEGTYTGGGNTFRLKITDMAAIGALAGLGSAFGLSENKEDAAGYEKTGTVDGHMQTEAWRNGEHAGKFGVMVDNRYMIEADGNAGSIDELKAAVAAVDQGALKNLGG